MKTLNKTLFFITFLISLSGFSQDKKPTKTVAEKSKSKTDKLDDIVKLSPDQKNKINAINYQYIEEVSVIDNKIKELKKAKKNLKNTNNLKIDTILTSNQKTKLEAEKKKKKHQKKK